MQLGEQPRTDTSESAALVPGFAAPMPVLSQPELTVRGLSVYERSVGSVNGLAGIGVIVAAALGIVGSVASDHELLQVVGSIVCGLTVVLTLFSFRIVGPNEAYVCTFFGSYKGVLRKQGLRVIAPLYSSSYVSVRLENFETDKVKANDLTGCPVDVQAVVVWRVTDAAQSQFHVQNAYGFVAMQTESALRTLVSQYPYDSGVESGIPEAISLRNGGERVAETLCQLIQSRVRIAGIEVVESRLSHLAYSQEIAQVMLMRQQAQAVIAARRAVVDGAVGIVKDTLDRVGSEILTLSPEGKERVLSNLLTTLVNEHNVQTVLPLSGN